MHRRSLLPVTACTALACLLGPPAFADVKPHALISDNMVLQRDMKVPIWGTADEGEKVTVHFQDQEATATAKDGKWLVRLDKLKAGGPYEMTITGNNKIHFKNVLVGEVWVGSGQSNMWWPVSMSAEPKQVASESKNPQIRLFTVPNKGAAQPQHDLPAKLSWQECGPDTVPGFSAVLYHFGKDLQKALDVPVGLIHSSVGGTPAEAWTAKAVLEAHPELKGLQGAGLYNGMIAPLQPYAIRGVIWYQGESNADRHQQYRALFSAMIKGWREDWKQGDFPFLFVQLAPWQPNATTPKGDTWARLREAQLQTAAAVPNTAMAVITDAGDRADIHPKQKEPVGARLALAARVLAYGEKVEYSGPVYDGMKVEGDKAVLSFKHAGGGLAAKGGELEGFTIAGEDHRFVKAQAEIKGDHVVVSSPQVAKPVAVRYGWANFPVVNLTNKDGLPATPFRTDDYPPPAEAKPAAGKKPAG
jgi:sialate O-acetylesterase